jgi:2-polyprenyl-6-methoxyphenol hydroxylase-like FAD-dependent oxidoreductase
MKPVRFDELPVRHPYIAFVPQWDLLNLLADEGSRLPNFSLRMQAEATELVHSDGRVVGVRYGSPSGSGVVRADLTVGADGRNSIVREGAGLKVAVDSPPMDVLWFRLPRVPGDGDAVFMRIAAGTLGIFLNRGDYWQIGLSVPKGTADELRSTGIGGLRARVATLEPRFRDRLDAISGWDQVALLTVRSDRVRPWWAPGLLLIGDAAHAMSPIGGVGINLAVQDAVATANLLGQLLAGSGEIPDSALELVQRRREPPTRSTQRFQERLQRQVLSPVLGSRPSPILKMLPALFSIRPVRRAFMRRVLVGYRPERVLWPSAPPSA